MIFLWPLMSFLVGTTGEGRLPAMCLSFGQCCSSFEMWQERHCGKQAQCRVYLGGKWGCGGRAGAAGVQGDSWDRGGHCERAEPLRGGNAHGKARVECRGLQNKVADLPEQCQQGGCKGQGGRGRGECHREECPGEVTPAGVLLRMPFSNTKESPLDTMWVLPWRVLQRRMFSWRDVTTWDLLKRLPRRNDAVERWQRVDTGEDCSAATQEHF